MILKFSPERFFKKIAHLITSSIQAALASHIEDGPGPVAGASRSATGKFLSHKMADVYRCRLMPVGSKLERIHALYLEFCRGVAGFITQCRCFGISWVDARGKSHSVNHRPDGVTFFEPPQNATTEHVNAWQPAAFFEVKDVSFLKKHADDGEGRYVFDEGQQKWRCPAAETVAKEMYGFGYDVVSSDDLKRLVDPVLSNNGEFIHDFCDKKVAEVPQEIVASVRARVVLEPGITLRTLLNSLKDLKSDHFFKLVVDGVVYVDFQRCQLTIAEDVRAFADREMADAFYTVAEIPPTTTLGHAVSLVPGELLIVCGRRLTVKLAGDSTVYCEDENGVSTPLSRQEIKSYFSAGDLRSLGVPNGKAEKAMAIFRTTSPQKIRHALSRYEPLRERVQGLKRRADTKEARLSAKDRYWLKHARLAFAEHGCGVLGCIDNLSKRGCKGTVLTPTEAAALNEGAAMYADKQAPSMVSAYGKYEDLCKSKHGVIPVSLKVFRKRVNKYAMAELIRRREGAGAASQHASPVDGEDMLDMVGRYYFHVGHMDEFKLDLALIFPELGMAIGQAWVVALIDGYSRSVLGLVVTFYAPSYITTMMVLRDCVHRWGRLPRVLGMDNGPGFRNESLILFLDYYDIQPHWRPLEQPRWGAQIERFGGSTNQRIANELPGATKIFNKHKGRISKTHDPARLAVYSLEDAAEILESWCFTVYDTLPHSGLNGKSPREVREQSIRDHGERQHLSIEADEIFDMQSLPSPGADGTLLVQAHDGVQVDGLLYWHESMGRPGIADTRVQVRWDPFNITVVYAFVAGEWRECDCIKLLYLRRLTVEELCAVTIMIRQGRKKYNRDYPQIRSEVRAFLDSKEKTPQQLEDLLRAKASAKQALRNRPALDLGDDDAALGTGSEPQGPRPIPAMPSTAATSSNYGDLK